MGWILGPVTIALFVVTVIAAATGFTSWPPLLAAAVTAAVAGSVLFVLGPRAARQQQRTQRIEAAERDR
ncbi:hypothetical protein DEJ31_11495 [Curtobacterium sp. MCPF17_031]|nr:hypothetical protein DEI89_09540 [Curtobacterium sp. MCBD17_030]PZE35770.1 hypothetical protein DEJ31_11495 [Curtobacterium sp. MCPF17_031]